MRANILLVDADRDSLAKAAQILAADYAVTAVASFEQARSLLEDNPPDLLITDLRLGEYNGLHLILLARGYHPHTAAILTDTSVDRVVEAEAHRLGASYLLKPLAPAMFRAVVASLFARPAPQVARPISPKELTVRVAEQAARILDVSYNDVRLEMDEPPLVEPQGWIELSLPDVDVPLRAKVVWSRPGGRSYGLDLSGLDAESLRAWREFIDRRKI